MAQSYQTFTATAGQTSFVFTTPYLRAAHLHVAIDGVAQLDTDFTVSGSVLTWSGTALVGGESFFIYRTTPVLHTERVVDWVGGARITEGNLDDATLQLLYLVQELQERTAFDLTKLSATDALDAEGRKITDLATPTAATDAVTKAYADGIVAGAGNLPAVGGGDNDSGIAVVGGAWATQTKAQLQTLWEILTQAAGDLRYAQLSQNLADFVDVAALRTTLEVVVPSALNIVKTDVNTPSPGAADLILDPGGNWWESATTKIDLGSIGTKFSNQDETRYVASVARTSGTPNVDDFIGLLENGGVQVSFITPSSVSGSWREVTGGQTRTFTDDGAGNLTGTGLDAASVINYETGQITLRASGAENVEDGTVAVTFQVQNLRLSVADQAVERFGMRDGLYRIDFGLTLRNVTGSDRTIKAALTDDVSSASTQIIRHLWRTLLQALTVKADSAVGLAHTEIIEVRSTELLPYLCLRAVCDAASAVTIENYNITAQRLGN